MNPVILHFPNSTIMNEYLSKHPKLQFKNHNITVTVVKLATARFADSEKSVLCIQNEIEMMVYDLQRGQDGFTYAQIGQIEGTQESWNAFSKGLLRALLDCVTNHSNRSTLEVKSEPVD